MLSCVCSRGRALRPRSAALPEDLVSVHSFSPDEQVDIEVLGFSTNVQVREASCFIIHLFSGDGVSDVLVAERKAGEVSVK